MYRSAERLAIAAKMDGEAITFRRIEKGGVGVTEIVGRWPEICLVSLVLLNEEATTLDGDDLLYFDGKFARFRLANGAATYVEISRNDITARMQLLSWSLDTPSDSALEEWGWNV